MHKSTRPKLNDKPQYPTHPASAHTHTRYLCVELGHAEESIGDISEDGMRGRRVLVTKAALWGEAGQTEQYTSIQPEPWSCNISALE